LTESLSPQLIDYLRWTRWDGRLPQVTGGGSGSLISVPLPTADAAPPPARPGGAVAIPTSTAEGTPAAQPTPPAPAVTAAPTATAVPTKPAG
jgi:hypothetical protein